MIEQSSHGLRISGPMLIADARTLLETGRTFLRAGLATEGPLTLDLSAVAETDSSALAVLFGLLRSARECGVDLRVAQPPASMLSLAALYGVSESLPVA